MRKKPEGGRPPEGRKKTEEKAGALWEQKSFTKHPDLGEHCVTESTGRLCQAKQSEE
jgi:hypothetical protein